MSVLGGSTNLLCLFHSNDHAEAAVKDIIALGVPSSSITSLTKETSVSTGSAFENLGVRSSEADHLRDCLEKGGTIVFVSTTGELADGVERIFHEHEAVKVQDSDITEEGIATAPHDREVIEPLLTRIYRRLL